MPDQIFISYRRDDAAYVTGHINDLLRKEFGDAAVFTDVDNIALGVDFRAVLDETVSQCQVLLAVIGANWLTVRDQEGQPRLQDPADFVRIEIESALNRNIPVIPLLVSGAKMPAAEELPDTLQGLAFRNGTQIRPAPDFGVDMARLIKNLRRHFGTDPQPVTAGPTAEGERTEELSPAEEELSETSATGIRVEEEERARRRAELGIGSEQPKKRWAVRFSLAALVVLAGASLYFVGRKPDIMQAVLPAIFGTEQVQHAGDDIEAVHTGDTEHTGEVGPPADDPAAVTDSDDENTEADLHLADTAGNDSETTLEGAPESESKASVATSGDTADDTATTAEPVADAADETGDQTDAADEVVDDAGPGHTAAGDTAPEMDESEEVVLSPGTQRKSDASGFISEGVRLAAIGDHEGAIQNFDEAIELDVEPSFIYKQRGASYQALEQYEAAVNDYSEAVQLNDEDVNAYYNRGVSHFALQEFEPAIADFDSAIRLDPEFVDAYSRRADVYEAMGNAEAAMIDRAAAAEFE